MSDASPSPRPFRVTGRHVLAAMVGFFAIVIALDTYFVTLAIRTFPGEVSRTPYEDGLAYNSRLAQQAAQARIGWRASAAVEPDGRVVVRVISANGAPVTGLKGEAAFERPATEAGRMALKLMEGEPGEYVARPGRIGGSWDLTATFADVSGRRFVAERRLSWP